jgi:TonB family protein
MQTTKREALKLQTPAIETLPSRLVIQLTRGQAQRSILWSTSRPLPLGQPFRWVLEKCPAGIRIRDLTPHSGKSGPTEVTLEQIRKGARIQLDDSLQLFVRTTIAVPSVVDSSHDATGDLQIYARSGKMIHDAKPIGALFTAPGQFAIRKAGSEYQIDPLGVGLQLRTPDGAVQSLSTKTSLSAIQLLGSEILSPALTWRFGRVTVGKLPKASAADRKVAEDSRWFSLALSVAILFVTGLVGVSLLIPTPEEEKPKEAELIPAQYTKLIMKAPKQTESAAGQAGKQSAASPSKAQNSQMAQAFRSKALQSAVSGLLKGGMTTLLQQSDFVNSGQSAKNASNVFSGPTEKTHSGFQGMTQARDVKVDGVGGNGLGKNAVGYGTAEKASVNGQGNSFVDLDTAAASVAKGLTKDEVGRVIHAHLSEVRYCYESAMIRSPDIEGKLVVDFTINPSGVVSTTAVNQTTLPDPRLDDCILRRLATWKFPLPRGGVNVDVTYPFIFKSLGR